MLKVTVLNPPKHRSFFSTNISNAIGSNVHFWKYIIFTSWITWNPIVEVQVGIVKIYVARVQAFKKKERREDLEDGRALLERSVSQAYDQRLASKLGMLLSV
jgi:hypothetical protein